MNEPQLTKQQLWKKLMALNGATISSLTGRSSHTIAAVDQSRQQYIVAYNSGNERTVKLDELYALYLTLCRSGSLINTNMERDCKQILGWKHWHAPGSAMFAVLPRLDKQIRSEGGNLYVSR